MVSIVAFQAVDPGSTPGQRTFHNYFFSFFKLHILLKYHPENCHFYLGYNFYLYFTLK